MANHTGLIELVIRPGNMQMLGRIGPMAAPNAATEDSLLKMLSAHSIEPTEDVTRRISELVTSLQKGLPPRADVLLAEGVPPVPGTDGHIVWAEGYGPDRVRATRDDDEIDYYAQSDIMSISAGDLVCTIVPPTRGRPGRDIYGREVSPRKGRRCPMVFGESIAHDPDNPPDMIALKSGRLNIVGQHTWPGSARC
ncbi:MAG: DUF342 domain-containing protein [Anaerolineaceae bacterium]|nr:DUF342 domain-containing protein [Anaerolineaceae bacterium]